MKMTGKRVAERGTGKKIQFEYSLLSSGNGKIELLLYISEKKNFCKLDFFVYYFFMLNLMPSDNIIVKLLRRQTKIYQYDIKQI